MRAWALINMLPRNNRTPMVEASAMDLLVESRIYPDGPLIDPSVTSVPSVPSFPSFIQRCGRVLMKSVYFRAYQPLVPAMSCPFKDKQMA